MDFSLFTAKKTFSLLLNMLKIAKLWQTLHKIQFGLLNSSSLQFFQAWKKSFIDFTLNGMSNSNQGTRMEFHFDLPMCKSIIARHTYTYTLYLIGKKRDFFSLLISLLFLKVVPKRFWLLKIVEFWCSKLADFQRACLVNGGK